MSRRFRVVVAIIVALVAVVSMAAYGVTRVRHWHSIGVAGLTFFPVTEKGQARVFGIDPGAVFMVFPGSAAADANIRPRDAILSINGVPIGDNKALERLDKRLHTGDAVTYRLRRGGTIRDATIALHSPLQNEIFVANIVVSVIVAMAFLAIGLFVFAKQPDDRRVIVFYAMLVVGAIYLVSAPSLALDASNIRGIYAGASERNLAPFFVLIAAAVAFMPLTLHLALVFPRDRPIVRSSPRILYWVYGVPAVVVMTILFAFTVGFVASVSKDDFLRLQLPLNVISAVLTLVGFVLALRIARRGREEGIRSAFWNRPVQSLIFCGALVMGLVRVADAIDVKWLEFGVGLLVGLTLTMPLLSYPVIACVVMYRAYRDAGAEERRQVKWPLWGTLIALGTKIGIGVIMQIGAFALMAAHRDATTWLAVSQILDVLSTLLYLLIPISFAVAILKYRLMNIDFIIQKTVVYAMLSTLIIVVYLALVGGLGTLLVSVAGVRNQTLVIASTLVVALLFVPLRNKVQKLVDRNLFRHRYDYPEALRAISMEGRTASDAGELLTSVAEKLQQALQNRSIVVFAEKQGDYVATAKVGVSDAILGRVRVPHEFGELLDRPFDPRKRALGEAASAALSRIEAALVVPVARRGFIAAGPKLSGGALEVEDIDFLRTASDELAAAMERIRMQGEEADYVQARAIQQTLLPREMPRVEKLDVSGVWQPARTMGGDYYDLLKLSDRELAVCIGDVAGKGMPAALLMSGLQAAVRSSASNSPRDLCERVRRVVVSSLSGGRFVTFFYATIDSASMTLRWCNAGHNAPILARADGSVVRLSDGGPAISRLFRDRPYEERELALAEGDRLVLFTDGVSEATDGNGEMFGEHRVEALVTERGGSSASGLQKTIIDAVTSFSEGELDDDLTLVVVAVGA